jgi:magnesium-protoporphyrin IX monomethyl ester (oxidative) cyclase
MHPKKILLAWPSVKSLELKNFLPLGLGYLASNLRRDYELKMWDAVLNCLPNEKVIDEIEAFKPDLVGVSVWNFNLTSARELVSCIKKHFPDLPVVAGGPEPSGWREKFLDSVETDYAFAGEGEISFARFLDALFSGRLTAEVKKEISGLIWRDEDGKPVSNPPRWERLDDIEHCDYEFINLNGHLEEGYHYGFHSKARRTAPVLITRGCPFSCEYCSARLINGRKVRIRPLETVIAEIKELRYKYNIDGFNIIDDNFTFNIDFAKEVCREILKLSLNNVSFNSPNGVRIEYLDEEILKLMKQVGWKWIFVAPESGSESTLKSMNKKINLAVVRDKIDLIKDAGLNVFGFFIIGYPGETVEDIRKTLEFARKSNFDTVYINCFRPLAGTLAYEKLLAAGEIEKLPEGNDYLEVSYTPKEITKRQLEFYRFWGMLRFYTSNLKRLKAVLTRHSFKKKLVFLEKFLP